MNVRIYVDQATLPQRFVYNEVETVSSTFCCCYTEKYLAVELLVKKSVQGSAASHARLHEILYYTDNFINQSS